jgi:hypothetical protein
MERQRLLETMQNSVGALQLVQRMTLSQKLANSSLNLRAAAMMVDALSRNTAPLDEVQKQLAAQKVNELLSAVGELDQLQRQFGVTNGEIAALNALGQQTQSAMENAKTAATQSATTQPLGAGGVAPSATTMPTMPAAPATTAPAK